MSSFSPYHIEDLAEKIIQQFWDIARNNLSGMRRDQLDPSLLCYYLLKTYLQGGKRPELHLGYCLFKNEEVNKYYRKVASRLGLFNGDSLQERAFHHSLQEILAELPAEQDHFHALYIEVYRKAYNRLIVAGGKPPSSSPQIDEFISRIIGQFDLRSIIAYAPFGLGPALMYEMCSSPVQLAITGRGDQFHSSMLHALSLRTTKPSMKFKEVMATLNDPLGEALQIDQHDYLKDTSAYSRNPSLIIALTPIGMPWAAYPLTSDRRNNRPRNNPDTTTILRALNELNDAGKAVILTSHSFLMSRSSDVVELRENLVTSGVLESVVAIPQGHLVGTSISGALITIDKSRDTTKPVLMIDAKNYVKNDTRSHTNSFGSLDVEALWGLYESGEDIADISRRADASEIADNDYNLIPKRYTIRIEEDQETSERQLLSVEQILEPIRAITDAHYGKLVTPSQFDDIGSTNSFNDAHKVELPRHVVEIKEECLLISKINRGQIKIAHFLPSEDPIYVKPSFVYALKASSPENTNLEWLALKLISKEFQPKFERISVGPNDQIIIKWDDLKFLKLAIPRSTVQQKEEVMLAKGILLRQKAAEEGYENLVNELEAKHKRDVETKIHSLAKTAPGLESQLHTLRSKIESMLSKLKDNPSPIDLPGIIGTCETISRKAHDAHESCIELCDSINNLGKELILSPVEKIEILPFLKEYFAKKLAIHPKMKITILHGAEGTDDTAYDELTKLMEDPMFVDIASKDLEEVLTQIFDNAKNSFADISHNDPTIFVKLSYLLETNEFSLLVANNGKPLAKNMNTKKFCTHGEWAGPTGQSGIGGAHIEKILRHVDGKVLLHDFLDENQTSAKENPYIGADISPYIRACSLFYRNDDYYRPDECDEQEDIVWTVGTQLILPNKN